MMRGGRIASTITGLAALAAWGAGAGCAASRRDPGTVVYASGADLESANPLVTVHPLARQIQRYALFVTLARYDDSLQAAPYYAKRWWWSADRRQLSFSLTPGLTWQDGVPTTASDVVFTLDAARDPATGYPRYADLADLKQVSAVDDTTVMLHFAHAQPHFPLVLCELPIVPRHVLGTVPHAAMRSAPFGTHPVGNGPFRFVERRPGERWVFARNPDFPVALGGPPHIARLVVVVVDEASTKFAGLVSGELDVAGIAPFMAELVARDRALRVLEYPVLQANGIIFNVLRAPFNDVRVRRAIGMAINRKRVIAAALAGYGTPAAGPVPSGHPYALPDSALPASARLDTARADSLLDAAGWRRDAAGIRARDGRRFSFQLLTVGGADNAVEELLQADLAAVGIRMEIRQREMASFLAEARATPRRFDALFTGIPGDVSLSYLSAMYDSRQAGGALDYAGFHTPALDSLLERARTAPEGPAARDAWYAVQRELARDAPAVWVYHSRGVQGLSRRLTGVRMDLRGELVTLHDWRVTDSTSVAAAR
ncbi:MAG: ABC transporter substrate-binding protein [Gemmatimonadaceae bacterium]